MLDRLVSHYMSTPIFSISADADLKSARERLDQHGVSALLVQDGGDPLAGVVSRTDLLRAGRVALDPGTSRVELSLPNRAVRDVASAGVFTVDVECATVRGAARRMVDHAVHRVFAVKAHHPYGVVSTRDVMRALVDSRCTVSLGELMSTPVQTLEATDTLKSAVDALREAQVGGLVVLDGCGWPVGMFTQDQALQSAGYPSSECVEQVMSHRFIVARSNSSVHHVAAQAFATRARHAIVRDDHGVVGIMSGLDFMRAAL